MDLTWCCVSQKARFQCSPPIPWIYCSIANWYTNFGCFPIKCLGSSNLFFNQKNRKENWASKPKTYRVQLRITRNSKLLKRLDQGHLHPNLEGWRLTCPGQESNTGLHGGRWVQLFISYSEHLHMSLHHGSPQCMCYMNIHEPHEYTWTALGCRPNSICKTDGLMPSWCLASLRVFNYFEVTTLTKVISIIN
jgi:hypothetical protein